MKKTYKVKKGQHRSGFYFSPVFSPTEIIRTVTFTDSCIYYPTHTQIAEQVNKLFGYSLGYHKDNSFRFGWRANWQDKCIELFAYTYLHKDRYIDYICNLPLNIPHKLSIYRKVDQITYVVGSENNIDHTIYITEPISVEVGYKLFPFFGGKAVAPQNILIEIE